MSANRVDVGSIRREQIVDAAIAVIAEQGIQHLSLSEIEKKTGMARGQLTYYYKTKEDILLGVFDRLIDLMRQRATASNCPNSQLHSMPHGWERCCGFLTMLLLQPPELPAFYPLQYTFLSQISHREDFRERLAKLYSEWRHHMAEDFAPELANKKTGRVSPTTFATLVQAILHGLAIQRAADPDAYERQEMFDLVVDLLGNYLRPPLFPPSVKKRTRPNRAVANGHSQITTPPKGLSS
jgi:AcrR family transcriptional regulator